ncbi:MAG: MarC family protein [Phycisphaerae bacterium]|nr:MarC family protein [Phycisphaerae bacterium]
MISLFINTYVKMFFLLAPFFSVSMFLSLAGELNITEKRRRAVRTSISMLVTVLIFFFFGAQIFSTLGITLGAFQVGAGTLLFLNAIALVSGKKAENVVSDDDFSIVPLAIPLIVGPGTIGTLFVLGAELETSKEKLWACGGILLAALTVSVFLYMATTIERMLGKKVLAALTKLTGLILASLAAQIVFAGIRALLGS